MLTRTVLATLLSTMTLAGCLTSPEDGTEQAQSGSDDGSGGDATGGTGAGSGSGADCIEGACGSGSGATATCEQADAVGTDDAVHLSKHDPSSRGQRCLDCHDGVAHPEFAIQPPTFDFGGRVVDPQTGMGRKAVVRMPSTEGFIAVESNDLGYFWWPPAGDYGGANSGSPGEVTNRATFPVAVGVETGNTLHMMCAKAINGNCASCHDGTTTAAIF